MGELATIKPRINEHIVHKLEELLSQARAGEIVGLACTAEVTGGIIDSFVDSLDLVTLLGHLSRQAHVAQRALDKSSF